MPPANSNSASAEPEISTTATPAAPSELKSWNELGLQHHDALIEKQAGLPPQTISRWRRSWAFWAKLLPRSQRSAMARRLIRSGSRKQLRGGLWLASISKEREEP